jgi:thiamine pyrophosphokinase
MSVRAIIVADGDIPDAAAVRGAMGRADESPPPLVVAADGGAIKAAAAGLRPQIVVGDGDSLAPDRIAELRSKGVEVKVFPQDKNESDTELAVREALSRGATSLTLLGAIGGPRLEHSIANLLLLALPELAGMDVALIDGPSTVRVIGGAGSAQIRLSGEIGDWVSLLPLSEEVQGVTTVGLRFPLTDATLLQGATLGLSNELGAPDAEVHSRVGRLAVIHTKRTGGLSDV